jgi:RNA polymerase sigma factor (sigma-70 family)
MMRSEPVKDGPIQDGLAARAGALFAAYQAGEQARMADLVTLLTPLLWHTVRAQNVDHAGADDVVQTAWLALLRAAPKIADPKAVLQWLLVTAKREAWRVSRADRRVEPQELDDADEVLAASSPSPETAVVDASGNERLWTHINRLPERCRELLRVIAFADRPDYASIADALGMPVGSIGPTRGRCLAKLRAQLAADAQWEI